MRHIDAQPRVREKKLYDKTEITSASNILTPEFSHGWVEDNTIRVEVKF